MTYSPVRRRPLHSICNEFQKSLETVASVPPLQFFSIRSALIGKSIVKKEDSSHFEVSILYLLTFFEDNPIVSKFDISSYYQIIEKHQHKTYECDRSHLEKKFVYLCIENLNCLYVRCLYIAWEESNEMKNPSHSYLFQHEICLYQKKTTRDSLHTSFYHAIIDWSCKSAKEETLKGFSWYCRRKWSKCMRSIFWPWKNVNVK